MLDFDGWNIHKSEAVNKIKNTVLSVKNGQIKKKLIIFNICYYNNDEYNNNKP